MPIPLSLGAEIATYLQSQGIGSPALNFSGAGTKSLFVDALPDDAATPELAAGIFEGGGLPPVMVLTGGDLSKTSKLDRAMVQIRVRAPMGGYISGNTLINQIMGALQGIANTQLNPPSGATFTLLMAQQSPVYLGRDELQRFMWSLNFHSWWVNDQR